MQVLLTFVGFHDPTYRGPVDGQELKGPILYLLGIRRFHRVYLFSAANTMEIARRTAAAIAESVPGTEARILEVGIPDPIDYVSILQAIRTGFAAARQECGDEVDWAVSTASGTPQMHASWVMLAASGELPAAILQTRPPQFVTTERPAVQEVDLAGLDARTPPAREGAPRPADAVLLEELGIVGREPKFLAALERAAQFARSPLPVLIQGETGTGKELVARYIHRLSGLPADRLHALNCAALPRDLAESLLFGYRKGAFTGALEDRKGAFELAAGGSLFLDEVSELAPEVQAKLLRVLQDGMVQPLGAPAPRKVSFRIIAATNRDLRTMVAEKTFREDLYFRLEVGVLRLPPLAERRGDIPRIAIAALENVNARLSRPRRFTPAALAHLASLEWPGNVRGLLNAVERTAQLSAREVIDRDDLVLSEGMTGAAGAADGGAAGAAGGSAAGAAGGPGAKDALPEPHEGFDLHAWLEARRRELFLRALELAGHNASAAARLLGVSPQAVSKFLKG